MPRDIRNAPRPRNGRPGFHTKVIQLDLSDGLLDPLSAIAAEKGVSLYRVIREFLYLGIKNHFDGQGQVPDRRPLGSCDDEASPRVPNMRYW